MFLLLLVAILLIAAFVIIPPHHPSAKTSIKLAEAMTSPTGPLASAIDSYRLDVKEYPSRLTELVRRPSDGARAVLWCGPYSRQEDDLKDPWGRMIQYRCPGVVNPDGFDLFSLGPDGVEGTDDDIMGETRRR